MAAFHLVMSVLLAASLNASHRSLRVAGTLLAAAALFMISISILLSNFDGTFAGYQPHALLDHFKPIVLDLQASIGLLATLFLLWAAWAQIARSSVPPLPLRNNAECFGRISRYTHWITATLMLLLVPMGLFISVLPPSNDRATFLAAHQALGLTVLLVVIVRITWLVISPRPPINRLSPQQRRLAHAAHVGLYALIIAFPITGFLMSTTGNEEVLFYGLLLPHPGTGSSTIWQTLHDTVLPFGFYGVIFLHIGAVLKHHFIERRHGDVRRMLR